VRTNSRFASAIFFCGIVRRLSGDLQHSAPYVVTTVRARARERDPQIDGDVSAAPRLASTGEPNLSAVEKVTVDMQRFFLHPDGARSALSRIIFFIPFVRNVPEVRARSRRARWD